MKKSILLISALLMFVACGRAMAFTVELDPITPLTGYTSMAEWDTDGDFEDWTYNADLIDVQVSGGDFIAKAGGGDPNMSLNIDALTPFDSRMDLATAIGTVFEIRMQFATNTLNGRVDFWATINGSGPGSWPPMQFAAAGGAIPDVPTDGQFHVFRLTLEAGDNYIGNLNALRMDPVADAPPIGETFKVDYFRVANVTNRVVVIKVDGTPLPSYTSLAEWNTDGDLENWMLNGITNETVSGGIFSGEPNSADPWFYKNNGMGMPQVNLALAPYAEFRLKQAASSTASDIEVFFGTTNNPGLSGARRVAIPATDIPHDGQFHIYRYRMAVHPDWNGVLEGFRVDPYTDGSFERFEIDYVRVGDTVIPEPALLLGIALAGIAILRKRF